MTVALQPEDVRRVAEAGYYLALRVGFAFPMEEVNLLPAPWVEHYTSERYMLADPVIQWLYSNTGAVRWSSITLPDPRGIMQQAKKFGLRYGVAICVFDGNAEGQRSFGSFARSDREFEMSEITDLSAYVERLHFEKAPPRNLTAAEIEALAMIRDGKRLKQIAYELGVTEGAIKQRLKNAKLKLGAKTGPQAAAWASQFGLI